RKRAGDVGGAWWSPGQLMPGRRDRHRTEYAPRTGPSRAGETFGRSDQRGGDNPMTDPYGQQSFGQQPGGGQPFGQPQPGQAPPPYGQPSPYGQPAPFGQQGTP